MSQQEFIKGKIMRLLQIVKSQKEDFRSEVRKGVRLSESERE